MIRFAAVFGPDNGIDDWPHGGCCPGIGCAGIAWLGMP